MRPGTGDERLNPLGIGLALGSGIIWSFYWLAGARLGGDGTLNELDENEEDLLDRAWGLEPNSRLSCQAILAQSDVTIEIPKYSINHAKENH